MLLQHGDVWHLGHLWRRLLQSEVKHPFQAVEFAVDRPVGRPLFPPLGDIALNAVSCDGHGPQATERVAQVLKELVQTLGAPALIDAVILPDPCGEVFKSGLLDGSRGLMSQSTGDLALPPLEQPTRLGLVLGSTGLVDRLAVLVILQPPGTACDVLAGLRIPLLSPIHHAHGRHLSPLLVESLFRREFVPLDEPFQVVKIHMDASAGAHLGQLSSPDQAPDGPHGPP